MRGARGTEVSVVVRGTWYVVRRRHDVLLRCADTSETQGAARVYKYKLPLWSWEHTCRKWGKNTTTMDGFARPVLNPNPISAGCQTPKLHKQTFRRLFAVFAFRRSPPCLWWWESTEEKQGGSFGRPPPLLATPPPSAFPLLRPASRSSPFPALPFRLLPPLALVCCVGRKLEISGRIIGREKRETDRKVGNGSEGTRLLATTVRVPYGLR